MKKIIRLTESDLTNIVKRVIKENSVRDSLIDMIKNDGWKEVTDMVGGDKNLKKLTGINTPMDFLHLFDDLDIVQSEENPDWTLFRYEPKHNLMFFDRNKNRIFINYDKIWEVLEDVFNLEYSEIKDLTKEWLSEVYNLRGVTPPGIMLKPIVGLSEVYNLRGVTPLIGFRSEIGQLSEVYNLKK